MSEDNVVSIKDFYNHETRISIVENAILGIEKRFDKIDNDLKEIKSDMKSDFRWILAIIGSCMLFITGAITGLTAIIAHGFHWF
ncbi:MAG TPA: hypothetical protein VGJ00_10345 [Rhabdochlamydiaceae bacterium]